MSIVRAISSEFRLEKLIDTLMAIALEHAGADHGFLICLQGVELRIEAEAFFSHNNLQIRPRQDGVTATDIPVSILHRAIKTQQSVVVNDCATPNPFSDDEYLYSKSVRSIICVPLMKNAEVNRVLYLENSTEKNAFTPTRIALLEFLATQAAVSLEKADRCTKASRSDDDPRLILNTIPIVAFVCAADGTLEFYNQCWLDYTGFTLEQSLGDGWMAALHPDDLGELLAKRRARLANGKAAEHEARIRRFDGQYRWFVIRVAPLRNQSGDVEKWYGACTDIEGQKVEEQNLKRSERYLLEAQQLSHCGSWSWNVRTRTGFWSQELFHILGYDPETISPTLELFLARVHPEDRPRMEAVVKVEMSGSDADLPSDYRIVLPDGTIKHLHAIAHPVRNDLGEVVEVVGSSMDVTERYRNEQLVRESEQMLRRTIATIPGLWSATNGGEIDFMNDRYLSYYAGDEVEGFADQGWLSHIHPDEVGEVTRQWTESVATGRPFASEFRRKQPDGSYWWFKNLGWPLRNSFGQIVRWYGLLLDTNERRNREQEMQRLQGSLARAMRLATAGELAASIAHEVSQPVAAVLSNAEASMHWLSESTLNLPNARRDVQRIVRDASDAAEVISRVRELFKRSVPKNSALNLNEIIAEVLRLMHNELLRRSLSVETELEEHLPHAWGDRVQIQQVILNLLLNGMEAMNGLTGGLRRLVISSKREGATELLVQIRDYGVGLKDGDSVFESFFTTKENGIGMGLSICRSIIHAHQGRIWTAPCEGPGASFRFTLPMEKLELPS
ncbi:PAS domain-containing protein [Granulicella arctica]|uniref:histidine kinase n=1 Tax=Granulicella arctica TaxID=940613 RepID=A0A7Y9PIT1_9BACT|nr:PAS domain S-box-containing protein [Granulicella arctica]